MIDYASAISAIETELAEIDHRRSMLERTLEGLRYLVGETAPRVVTPRKAPKAAKRPDARGKLSDGSGAEAKILDALRPGPMQPGDLAKAVGLSVPRLRYHVNKLLERRAVVATGNTGNRRIALPGKEAP